VTSTSETLSIALTSTSTGSEDLGMPTHISVPDETTGSTCKSLTLTITAIKHPRCPRNSAYAVCFLFIIFCTGEEEGVRTNFFRSMLPVKISELLCS